MYFSASVFGLAVGFGFIPWQKKGTIPSKSSDRFMKTCFKVIGVCMGLAFVLNIFWY
jgi:hypothetical protein